MPSHRGRRRSTTETRNMKRRDLDELHGLALEETQRHRARRPVGRPTAGVDWREEFQLFEGLTLSIAAQLDLRALVHTILDEAVSILGADRGLLFLGRQNAGGLLPVLAVNLSGEELQSVDRVSRTVLAEGRQGHFLMTPDALRDPKFAAVASVQANRMRSILCAPLIASTGQVGAIYLDAARVDAFPEGVTTLFASLLRVAATALQNAEVHGELVRENTELKSGGAPSHLVERLIGQSPAAESVRRQALALAFLDQPVWLTGEPGTGRSHLARVIHDLSRRSHGPFVSCDASVFPPAQVRRALLGRTGPGPRGTEAWENGLMREANHGTLSVGHAGALREDATRELVRMVNEGRYRPLGSRHDERLDVRLILSADPRESAEGLPPKAFRSLQPCQVFVPPLRERPEDIPGLLAHFLATDSSGREAKKPTFTQRSLSLLQQQPWPGNVRELKQVLQRILLLASKKLLIDVEETKAALLSPEVEAREAMGPWSGKIRTLREWEEEAYRQALRHTGGNGLQAARLLGVHRNTLNRKVKELRLR